MPNLSTETNALIKPEPTNALSPMVVTSGGMKMDVKAVVFLNASLPMLITPDGMSIDANLEQF